ncbi:MAG: methyltransferase family protein [Roseimicrobium sp.]
MPREKSTTMPDAAFAARGGWWAVAQSVLMAAVLVAGPLAGELQPVAAARVFAAALLTLGAVTGVAGARALGKNRTIYPMPLAHAQLVQSGIYALVRHPLYASLIYLSGGWALLWASWLTLGIALALAGVLFMKARREEAFLQRQFTDYQAYAARVKRFVPGVW